MKILKVKNKQENAKEGIFIKKDALRDYATSAFIFWARHGCPTYAEAEERIRKKALARAWGIDPQKAKQYADAEIEKARAGLEDIRACESVFRRLSDSGRELICDAVRAVYMAEPWGKVRRGEYSARALRFALEVPLSERQVYYYLEQARDLFAIERGLRIDDGGEW